MFKIFATVLFALTLVSCSSEYYAERDYWYANRLASNIFKSPVLTSSGLYDEAMQSLEGIIAKYPDSVIALRAHFMVARLKILKKDYPQARAELMKVTEQVKDRHDLGAEAQFALGQIHELEGSWSEAMNAYQAVVRRYPKSVKVLQVPIFIARKIVEKEGPGALQEAYEGAAEEYGFIANESPNTELAALALGYKARCLMAQEVPKRALEVYYKILAEHPRSRTLPSVLLNVAGIQRKLGRPEDALKAYESLNAVLPDQDDKLHQRLPMVLGDLYIQAGRTDEALETFNRVLEKYPDDIELCASARVGIGIAYEANGEWDTALKHYHILMQQYPNTVPSLQAYLRIVHYYQEAEEFEQAEEAHRRAITNYHKIIDQGESKTLTAAARNYISASYAMRGDWPQAVQNLKLVVEEYPNSTLALRAYFSLAEIYEEKLSEHDMAITTYKKVLSIFPDHKLANVAEAYLQQLISK